MNKFYNLLTSKSNDLFLYSNYSFLKGIDRSSITKITVIDPIISGIENNQIEIRHYPIGETDNFILVKYLSWDSDFFKIPTYKIELIMSSHSSTSKVRDAILTFIQTIPTNSYCFVDIPSEDTVLLQAISQTGFKLVETRLNYVLPLGNQTLESKYSVRKAEVNDIEPLRKISAQMRNPYDRLHADLDFSDDAADQYLAKFAEEAVKGFADVVLVPNLPEIEPFGFLAANKPVSIGNCKVSKYVLAAIDSSVERGWLSKLVNEMNYLLKNESADYVTTITQAANKPAISVWEKNGFKLYSASHIFTLKK